MRFIKPSSSARLSTLSLDPEMMSSAVLSRLRYTNCDGCDPIRASVERFRHDARRRLHVESRRDCGTLARHQEWRVRHVVHRLIPRRCDEERAIRPFDEGHHADKPDLDLVGGWRGLGGFPKPVQAAARAERNSTDKSTTIHFCSCIWGAIDRSRTAPTQSRRRVDGRSALLRCVGLCARACSAETPFDDFAVEADHQIASGALVGARQRSNDGRHAGSHERAGKAQRALASMR